MSGATYVQILSERCKIGICESARNGHIEVGPEVCNVGENTVSVLGEI